MQALSLYGLGGSEAGYRSRVDLYANYLFPPYPFSLYDLCRIFHFD
jgi:hypothetical protein